MKLDEVYRDGASTAWKLHDDTALNMPGLEFLDLDRADNKWRAMTLVLGRRSVAGVRRVMHQLTVCLVVDPSGELLGLSEPAEHLKNARHNSADKVLVVRR